MGPSNTKGSSLISSTSKPSFNAYKMSATLKNLYYKLTPSSSSAAVPTLSSGSTFHKAPTSTALFPPTTKDEDGEECLHDCESCTIKYPSKFSIDETEELYGHVKGWSTHLVVATGKTDWVRDVADEKGSVMEAVEKGGVRPENGKLMLSASNIPVPESPTDLPNSTTVLLLPAFHYIDNVTPENTPSLIRDYINKAPTNTSPLPTSSFSKLEPTFNGSTTPPPIPRNPDLRTRPCPHTHIILLCSQKTRDARCGQSAPILRREFERHLRPLGLHRDLHDERPGGVGIYFISHVGGHKFSANVMVYRRVTAEERRRRQGGKGAMHEDANANVNGNGKIEDALQDLKVHAEENGEGKEVVLDVNAVQEQQNGDDEGPGEAAQCIGLARIRPEDCENVIRYTVLQGKVVKPERQLRGGFDRCTQMVSW